MVAKLIKKEYAWNVQHNITLTVKESAVKLTPTVNCSTCNKESVSPAIEDTKSLKPVNVESFLFQRTDNRDAKHGTIMPAHNAQIDGCSMLKEFVFQ